LLCIGFVNSQHDSDPWRIDVRLNDSCNVNFKVDCGADVTCNNLHQAFGRFCYVRLPFGISTASEVFQKRMCRLLKGQEGTMCLIDDVLIFGKDQAEHDQRLEAVLQRLCDENITLNDKCEFSKQELKYVGHIFSRRYSSRS
jgi:hypothetical protein